jgi:type IV secretion system protein VirB11
MSGAAAANLPEGVYLASCLAPFREALSRADVTDIYVNRPHELWLETVHGSVERHSCEEICELTLARFARQVAALTSQGINREHPLLAATLPDGSRIQIVAPPATRGPIAIAIRKHLKRSVSLADLAAAGSFSTTLTGVHKTKADEELCDIIRAGKLAEGLALAVRSRRNIVVSGGTSTGKTTFLNALLREIPLAERLILIEDTAELELLHPNSVGLIAARGELREARVTTNDLVSASLRMRPDRIILGEVRGAEAFAFLRAVNSGHPGSMTTIHADTPERAVEQLAMLVLQSGTNLNRADVHDYVSQSIEVFVQLGRQQGRRAVETVALGSTIAGDFTK